MSQKCHIFGEGFIISCISYKTRGGALESVPGVVRGGALESVPGVVRPGDGQKMIDFFTSHRAPRGHRVFERIS
jgi:hypothetical protein